MACFLGTKKKKKKKERHQFVVWWISLATETSMSARELIRLHFSPDVNKFKKKKKKKKERKTF